MTDTVPTGEEPETRRKKIQLVSVIVFGLIFAFIGLLGWGLWQANRGRLESGKATDFTLTSFDGETIQLSDLEGQVVVVNFWASWCLPCREESPYLEATWRRYKEQGVIFIGVNYADTEPQALAYLEEFDITFFNGPDLGSRIYREYRVQGVPETFYIAKNGEIRDVTIGPVPPPELELKIEDLLAETYLVGE